MTHPLIILQLSKVKIIIVYQVTHSNENTGKKLCLNNDDQTHFVTEKSDELAEDADMLSSLTQEYETVFTFCSYDNQNIFSKPHLGHL